MNRQYLHLAITALISFGSFTAVLAAAKLQKDIDVLMVVFCAGSVGAVVNNYFRIAQISTKLQTFEQALENPSVTIQLYVSPLISGILGFVAYGLFVTGLLGGKLFPTFTHLDDGYHSITCLLSDVSPASNVDAAKAIVWAFIAGFSERFIPNVLGRLADESKES
jgi:hypothetical protein